MNDFLILNSVTQFAMSKEAEAESLKEDCKIICTTSDILPILYVTFYLLYFIVTYLSNAKVPVPLEMNSITEKKQTSLEWQTKLKEKSSR